MDDQKGQKDRKWCVDNVACRKHENDIQYYSVCMPCNVWMSAMLHIVSVAGIIIFI